VSKKVYRRLALCEISEDEFGQIIQVKLETSPILNWEAILIKDDNYRDRLWAALADLRTRENYTEYHAFCERLIDELSNMIETPE
jgi:hypothetical protein